MATTTDHTRLLLPLPTVTPHGDLHPGSVLPHPAPCLSCRSKQCKDRHVEHDATQAVMFGCCEQGWSVVSFTHGGRVVVLNGLIVTDKNDRLDELTRKRHHRHRMQATDVANILEEYRERCGRLDKQIEGTVSKKFGMVHEMQTAVNLVYRNMEPLVARLQGDTLNIGSAGRK